MKNFRANDTRSLQSIAWAGSSGGGSSTQAEVAGRAGGRAAV
jgi:hypothetical protein